MIFDPIIAKIVNSKFSINHLSIHPQINLHWIFWDIYVYVCVQKCFMDLKNLAKNYLNLLYKKKLIGSTFMINSDVLTYYCPICSILQE